MKQNERHPLQYKIAEDQIVQQICYGLRNLSVGDEEETRVGDLLIIDFDTPEEYYRIQGLIKEVSYEEAYAEAIRIWASKLKYPIQIALDCWLRFDWIADTAEHLLLEAEEGGTPLTDIVDDYKNEYEGLYTHCLELFDRIRSNQPVWED